MKKKILLGLLCCILIVAGILGGALAASAAEAKTIADNMDKIQQQLVAEEISLEQYTQSVRSLNQVLENKKLEEVYATVTYDQAIPVEEAYRMADEQAVQLERLEIRFYQDDEPFTAYIRNLGEEETMAQVAHIAQENEFSFSGVISTNITLPLKSCPAWRPKAGSTASTRRLTTILRIEAPPSRSAGKPSANPWPGSWATKPSHPSSFHIDTAR